MTATGVCSTQCRMVLYYTADFLGGMIPVLYRNLCLRMPFLSSSIKSEKGNALGGPSRFYITPKSTTRAHVIVDS
jgi:hypothetical protein